MEQKIETKKGAISTLILVLIVIAILVGVWYWWTKRGVTPVSPVKPVEKVTPKEDSVTAINQDLDKVEILDLDRQFQEIDQDLNSL
jgi:flagellar basal body-associated protein FliL